MCVCDPVRNENGISKCLQNKFSRENCLYNIGQYLMQYISILYNCGIDFVVLLLLFLHRLLVLFLARVTTNRSSSNIHIFFLVFGQCVCVGKMGGKCDREGAGRNDTRSIMKCVGEMSGGKQLVCVVNTTNYQSKMYV